MLAATIIASAMAFIGAAVVTLDPAFERQDEDAIKRLMTPDRIAVTPYDDGGEIRGAAAGLPEAN